MAYQIAADWSVGLYATIQMPVDFADYTGWVFAATFGAAVGDPHAIVLAMAANDASDGFRIFDGPNRLVTIRITPPTLEAYPNTSGTFQLFTNLLATPPGGDRFYVADLNLSVVRGPTA